MYSAVVKFRTRIKSNGVRFELVEFKSADPHVESIEIEGPNGYETQALIRLKDVRSPQEARRLAEEVHLAALDRIAFNHAVRLEKPERTGEEYIPAVEVDGIASAQGKFSMVNGIERLVLEAELEEAAPPGVRSYALFRSALQSLSPAESFMHLYHILLMIFNDSQVNVDAFIIEQEPSVARKQRPRNPSIQETTYTRLRNEMAHTRSGVNLATTKSEMSDRLDGLVALTKTAIQL